MDKKGIKIGKTLENGEIITFWKMHLKKKREGKKNASLPR